MISSGENTRAVDRAAIVEVAGKPIQSSDEPQIEPQPSSYKK